MLSLAVNAQQSHDPTIERTIPNLTFETVEGDKIELEQLQKEAYIFFLLPKPESKSAGKEIMDQIRKWVQRIETETENVFTILIAEPFKTSFPFFGIQKRKLKNESFPVVLDEKGEILTQFDVPGDEFYSIIANKYFSIVDQSVITPDSRQIESKLHLIEQITTANNK